MSQVRTQSCTAFFLLLENDNQNDHCSEMTESRIFENGLVTILARLIFKRDYLRGKMINHWSKFYFARMLLCASKLNSIVKSLFLLRDIRTI